MTCRSPSTRLALPRTSLKGEAVGRAFDLEPGQNAFGLGNLYQSEMRFTVVSPGEDIAVKAAKLHEIALEEAIEGSKASVMAAAGYQPLDFETVDHAENGEGPGVKAAK